MRGHILQTNTQLHTRERKKEKQSKEKVHYCTWGYYGLLDCFSVRVGGKV